MYLIIYFIDINDLDLYFALFMDERNKITPILEKETIKYV